MLEKWLPAYRGRHLPRTDEPQSLVDLMEEMLSRPFKGLEEFTGSFSPLVEVSEKDDELVVRAEVPGLKPEDIELSVENNSLIISGEKKQDKKEEKENYVHTECSYGSFYRVIPLRSEVDQDKIKASHKHGVLTIRLPKSEKSRSKKIAVESS